MTHAATSQTTTATTAELHTTLQHLLERYYGVLVPISSLDRRPAANSSSFVLEEIDLHLTDGTLVPLMFKDMSRHAMLAEARQAKPAFLYDPLREIAAYERILSHHQLGTAAWYGAAIDQDTERYWLFLERVAGLELYQVDLPTWEQVAAWLSRAHSSFAATLDQHALSQTSHLLRYDADFYRLWMRRVLLFARRGRSVQLARARQSIEWLAERYDQVVEQLVALPTTFIHGEFYASNIIVQQGEDRLRVCPIDWEMAAFGPGLIDLAALVAGGWTESAKTTLALAYYHALPQHEESPLALAPFLVALDCCRLHVALQWLGWSEEWVPPAEHTHNWLMEALQLAEKLAL